MEKLRVAYVISSTTRMGGSERHLLNLLGGLKSSVAGHAFSLYGAPGGRVGAMIRDRDVPLVHLDLPDLSIPSAYRAARTLSAHLRRGKADCLMTYGFGPSLVGSLASLFARIPLISARREIPLWRKGKHAAAFAWINLRARLITVNSQAVGRWTRREPFSRGKVQCIPNGVAVPDRQACEEKSPAAGSGKTIGMLANLRPVKNVAMLIRACPRVMSRFPGTKVIIIGEGEERERLQALIDDGGLGNAITLLGARDDTNRLLSGMDILVLTSLAEGSPHAVLEAMAHGLPVVATKVGGVPELVRHGENGYLVEVNDDQALSEKLADLLDQPGRARRLGSRGKRMIQQDYTLEKLFQRQLRLFQKVTGRKP